MLMPDTLVQILAAGGGLKISATGLMPDTLVQMARAAGRSGATLILRDVAFLMPDTLVQIGSASNGNVIFEL